MISPDEAAEMAATTDNEPDAWENPCEEDDDAQGGPLIVALGDDIDGVTLLLDNETGEILGEVTDKTTAIQFLKLCCPAAVKISESVLVSQIPASMELPESQGLRRVEPTDVFGIE